MEYRLKRSVDFEKVSKDEVDRALNEILKELGKIEYPDRVYQKLADILNDIRDNPEVKYISKSSIKKALFNGDDKWSTVHIWNNGLKLIKNLL